MAESGLDGGRPGWSGRSDHGPVAVRLAGVPLFWAAVPGRRGLLPWLVAVFVLVRLAEIGGVAPGWVRSYADDFLCLPLVLSLVLIAHRLVGRTGKISLPVSHGLLAVGVFAVFFEVILPVTGTAAVGDSVDVLMYLAGFLVFQFALNRSAEKRADHVPIPGILFSPHSPIT